MKKVAVGSVNPVKIKATRVAFEKVWPDEKWEVEGIEVGSNVSDQPMSDVESIKGALTRARKALTKGRVDYGVGLEGGIQKIGKRWFDGGWAAVIRKDGMKGVGSTAKLLVPDKMMKMIEAGRELGDVIDHFFSRKNSKQNEGHFGLMTKNVVTRTSGYVDGVVMALAVFINEELFD